jgi:hypothetical protein
MKTPDVDEGIELARRQVEERLGRLRQSVSRDLRGLPKAGFLLLPLAAFAVGLVLGMKVRRGRDRS